MKTEENKRMLALSYIVADLMADNMELEQRVQQLVDDYNNVVRQLNSNEKRKDEDPARLLLDNMQKMRDHCDELEKENRELERFSKAMNEFVIDKNLYVKKDNECPYHSDGIPVCSTDCLECGSCLGDIYDLGVICERRLKEANVSRLTLADNPL